ncbi:MAG: class I SAM-dependent methyltransferase [Ignavibacteria bacterium]|nr:class I SAM-dependent methyltransferase [Ignavibacteria bacterium]
MTETKTIEDFYAQLASDYNTFTEPKKRWSREIDIFRSLVQRYNITSAIDAGCGTGFHSLVLSQLGVNVIAADVSQEMLRIAENHAKQYKVSITFIKSSFQQLSQTISTRVDAVCCLGNSFPHCLTEKEQQHALQNFISLLKPNGVLILHLLNYDRILAKNERVQNVKKLNGKIFVRFYDFLSSTVRFNVLILKKNAGKIISSLSSVELYPIKKKEIHSLLSDSSTSSGEKFSEIQFYGGLSLENYSESASKDLVVIAQKQRAIENVL